MTVSCHPYATEDDFWRMREFLRQVFVLNQRLTRSAYVEPVATVPAHQRRGLAQGLMAEGLRRVQRMGATRVFVSGYSPAANALYRSVMGADYERYDAWVKEWRP